MVGRPRPSPSQQRRKGAGPVEQCPGLEYLSEHTLDVWRESVFVENHCGLPWSELIVLISSIIVGLTGLLLSKFQSKFNCDLITHLRAQIIRFSMNQVKMTNKPAPKKKMVAARRKE